MRPTTDEFFNFYEIDELNSEAFYELKTLLSMEEWLNIFTAHEPLNIFNNIIEVFEVTDLLTPYTVLGFTFGYSTYDDSDCGVIELYSFKINMLELLKKLNFFTVNDVRLTVVVRDNVMHDKIKISGLEGVLSR